jgi:hypothetical protein
VSDSQSETSEAVIPIRPAPDTPLAPITSPTTVKLLDPDVGRFDSKARLSLTVSALKSDETLPAEASIDTTVRRLPPSPCAVRHTSDVSELHVVISQAVDPASADKLASNSPNPRPRTVMLVDLIAGMLICHTLLTIAASAEYTEVLLAICSPAVTEARLLPPPSCTLRQATDESAAHSVASHADPPLMDAKLSMLIPRPLPSTWRLTDPVRPTLPRLATLIRPGSADTPHVALPVLRPVVSVTLRLEAVQPTVCASTDVSDTHELRSHELCPVLLQPEYAVDPRLSPCAVISAAPVDTAFDTVAVLRCGDPTDKNQVALPTARPAV